MPMLSAQKDMPGLTRQERRISEGFAKRRLIEFRDFRGNLAYEDEIAGLKEKIEKYISSHPELSDEVKLSLRELKIIAGFKKPEVELLLGKPDAVKKSGAGAKYGATSIWAYKKNKMRAFTVFIIPVFFVHEAYYLYFKDEFLAGIDSSSLKQTLHQAPARGVIGEEGIFK